MHALSPDVFAARRQRLMDEMGEDAVAIICAPKPRNRSNDTDYAYRTSSDVLYLSGFREPEAVLVLAPGHDEGPYVLFVPDKDPQMEQWEGRRAGPQGAMEDYGADQAFGLSELEEKLPLFLKGRRRLYYTLGSREDFDRRVVGWIQNLRHKRNKVGAAPAEVVDVRDLIFSHRLVKDEAEIGLIRKACQITAEAHILAMKYCRPGMFEYELQALIEYHFRRSGGEYPAYASIVGSGDNATILHYTENRDRIEEGHVVLIDAGCEYQFYAGDITRSFPASGKFTPAQRDIYQAVLEAEQKSIDDLRDGLDNEEWKKLSQFHVTEALVDIGLLKGSVEELVESKAFVKYYPHGIGHPIGLDVHDVGLVKGSESDTALIRAGMVMTVEPGIYVPADDEDAPKEMRGVGIRIEDDILVTTSGVENLTASCPKSVEDVEALVGSGDAERLKL